MTDAKELHYMDLMKDLGVEVYKDAARPAVSEVGAVAGRTVKALLAPIRGRKGG